MERVCVQLLLCLACLLALTGVLVEGFPTGAPAAACSALSPDPVEHLSQPQSTPVPYRIEPGIQFDYEPNERYMLSFADRFGNDTFRGFLIQARRVADGMPVGRFEDFNTTTTQFSSCAVPESAITHTNNDPKQRVIFTWVAPPPGTGTVRLRFAVVRTQQVYWANEGGDFEYEEGGYFLIGDELIYFPQQGIPNSAVYYIFDSSSPQPFQITCRNFGVGVLDWFTPNAEVQAALGPGEFAPPRTLVLSSGINVTAMGTDPALLTFTPMFTASLAARYTCGGDGSVIGLEILADNPFLDVRTPGSFPLVTVETSPYSFELRMIAIFKLAETQRARDGDISVTYFGNGTTLPATVARSPNEPVLDIELGVDSVRVVDVDGFELQSGYDFTLTLSPVENPSLTTSRDFQVIILDSQSSAFGIGGRYYPSHEFRFRARYIYVEAQSPQPFEITCLPPNSLSPLDWSTNNALVISENGGNDFFSTTLNVSLASSPGVEIAVETSPMSGMLRFSPRFDAELAGQYCCTLDSFEGDLPCIDIETRNPALDVMTSLPVMLTPGVSEFTLEVVGLYNTDGRTLVARASDYTLQFMVDGQTEEVESFGATTFDRDPYRRQFSVAIGRVLSQSAQFTLTLAPLGGPSVSITFDVVLPILPVYPAIVVREGQPLSIDCSTGDPIVDANYLEVFRGGEPPPRTTFASASLGESGTFQCALFGVTSDLVVRVIPVLFGEVSIYRNDVREFLPNEYILNDIADGQPVNVTCYGTPGNGELSWFFEDATSAVQDQLAAIRGQTGQFSINTGGAEPSFMVEYAGNAATLFISDVASLGEGTGTNYKCFSSEAQTETRIVITSVDLILEVRPSTPSSASFGENVTLSFTVACNCIEPGEVILTHNNSVEVLFMEIDDPNVQLVEYSFIAQQDSGGLYTMNFTGLLEGGERTVQVSTTLQVTIPELMVSPTEVFAQSGEQLSLTCQPSFPELPVTWYIDYPDFTDPIGVDIEGRFTFSPLNHTISFIVFIEHFVDIASPLNPPPYLELVPPIQDPASFSSPPFINPPPQVQCALLDGTTVLRSSTIDLIIIRAAQSVQIVLLGDLDNATLGPEIDYALYNGAVVDSLALSDVVLSCVGVAGSGDLFWSSTNEVTAPLLASARGATGTSTFMLSEYPGDVMTISVSPQELILVLPTRRDGEGGPSLLLGDYTCTSEASGESASFTFAEGYYVRSLDPPTLTLPIGAAADLRFKLAVPGVDYDVQWLLTEFTFLAPPPFMDMYFSHPNEAIIYIDTVLPQFAGNYSFQQNTGPMPLVSATVMLSVDTSVTLQAGENMMVQEGSSYTVSCTPSDSRVQLSWVFIPFFGDTIVMTTDQPDIPTGDPPPNEPSEPPPGESMGIPIQDAFEVVLSPPRLNASVSVASAAEIHTGSYACFVAGDPTGSIVSPGSVEVKVLLRCPESYAVGTVWPEAFEGDTVDQPCSRFSKLFSNAVLMYRSCGAFRQWSDVDLSACTLRAANPDPVLFYWFLMFTPEPAPDTDTADELNSFSDAIRNDISAAITAEYALNVSNTLLEIDSLAITAALQEFSEAFPVVYTASVSGSLEPIVIDALYSFLAGVYSASVGPFDTVTLTGLRAGRLLQSSVFCECRPPVFVFTPNPTIQRVCAGIIASPCDCTVDSCQCVAPFVGPGALCTLDSDQDGSPDQALLPGCTVQELSTGQPAYCAIDTCPIVFNLPQTNTAPCSGGACPLEVDAVYGLQWGFADAGQTVVQPCGPEFIGNASRECGQDGQWLSPDVQECRSRDIVLVETLVGELVQVISTLPPAAAVAQVQETVVILAEATAPEETSILPGDLATTSEVLADQLDLLIQMGLDQTVDVDALINGSTGILDVVNNVLDAVNAPAYTSLMDAGQSVGESLLDTSERYGLYLATVLGAAGGEMTITRNNIVLQALSVVVNSNGAVSDVQFPLALDRTTFAFTGTPAFIIIPGELLTERAQGGGVGVVPVSNILFQNLQDFLPSNIGNTTAVAPVSFILSSQVVDRRSGSVTLQLNPVLINFTVDTSAQSYSCVFWEFSDPVGSGGWSVVNVTTENIFTVGNETVVQCSSTHLTSFAVLVNVAGVEITSVALNVISYIGIAISLLCLLLTIIFFLSFGKKLFTAVHNFVHLNLAIALFLAYLVFAIGVDLGSRDTIGCKFVAALLQYLYLAVFCWMLCEGVMLYLMLVVVFSSLSKKWWFFLLLGWAPPVIFVAIGLGSALDGYGVRDENGTLQYCWLAANDSSHAIWTFAAPMLAIIIINTVFLVLVLVSLFRARSGRKLRMEDDGIRVELVVSTIKASVILLPLLGITWVLGLFAVNSNTLVFAWLFTIFNSLQGLFIFIFHVLRHERIWGRFKKKYSLFKSSKPDSQGTSETGKKKTAGGGTASTVAGSSSASGVQLKSIHLSLADKVEFEPGLDSKEGAPGAGLDSKQGEGEVVESTTTFGKADLGKREEEDEEAEEEAA